MVNELFLEVPPPYTSVCLLTGIFIPSSFNS
jgi:hypothetical protein